MPDYLQGSQISLYANYLDGNSSPILSGISGNMIDIYNYSSTGTRIYQVQSGTMTQDPNDLQRYYYIYTIPTDAQITNYVADYTAQFSGLTVNKTEVFGVMSPFGTTGVNIGSTDVYGAIVDISGTGIAGSTVKVSFLTGTSFVTSTVTSSSGTYHLYLDPNDYVMFVSAPGYNSNTVSQTVPTAMTTFNWGDTTLTGGTNIGGIVISDSVSSFNDMTQASYPMANLKVSLYARKGSMALTTPIDTTRTSSSGTWSMSAAAGEYVLRYEGNNINNTVYDTSYDIEVSDAYNTGLPLGFRYEGTSQYSFI